MMYYGRNVALYAIKKIPIDYKEVLKEASPHIVEMQLEGQRIHSLCDTFYSKSYNLKIDIEQLDDSQVFDLMRTEKLTFREVKNKYVNVFVTVEFNEPYQRLVKETERVREVERVYSTCF